MPDARRFAGFTSPRGLMIDGSLTREEKISGLRSWQSILTRFGFMSEDEQGERRELEGEINRALERLSRN